MPALSLGDYAGIIIYSTPIECYNNNNIFNYCQITKVKRSGHRYQVARVRDRQAHCPRAMKILRKFKLLLENIEAPPLLLSDINKFKNRYGRASEIFLHGIIQND